MKKVVSFEMAKALKEAGFFEPEQIRAGQLWYIDDELCVVVGVDSDIQIYYAPFSDFWTDAPKECPNYGAVYEESPYDLMDRGMCFAPTSADILGDIFTPEKNFHIFPADIIRMALDADLAATQWMIRNRKTTIA